jgi:putative oxidoreductase
MLLNILIGWPQRVATHLQWLGPLLPRITVGYTFMMAGWGKLTNLDVVTQNFIAWGVPFPHILTPFASGWEFVGGLLLIFGLLTRIAAGGLAVVMVVAILSAKLADIEVLTDILSFEETTFFVVFVWLAIAGAGRASLDAYLERKVRS